MNKPKQTIGFIWRTALDTGMVDMPKDDTVIVYSAFMKQKILNALLVAGVIVVENGTFIFVEDK